MSSTIRTLMRSLIAAGLPYWGRMTATRPWLLLERGRDRDLDDLGRQDTVEIDEGLEDHARGLDCLSGVRRRAQDRVERAGRASEQEHLGLRGSDRKDEQLVRARDDWLRAGGGRCLALGRGRGGGVE